MATLRSYIFIDQLQPQTMCYLGTWIRGSLPRTNMAAQIIEVAPGLDIEALTDIALKGAEVSAGMLVVARVRPRSSLSRRCGLCERRAPWYDRGEGRRRWRGLDWGTVQVVVEAEAPRGNCPTHGPTVVAVPWARHRAGHTLAFDATVAWLAVACSKTAVCELMRIAWRTVGAIVARVWADTENTVDRFAGLRRIGIDEISYKRHHKYLTVVVDHDTGRLLWAAPGRDKATLRGFFDTLGDERAAQITHVSADAAEWISAVVAERCPAAVLCADPFHVVAWATEALDAERRRGRSGAFAFRFIERVLQRPRRCHDRCMCRRIAAGRGKILRRIDLLDAERGSRIRHGRVIGVRLDHVLQ